MIETDAVIDPRAVVVNTCNVQGMAEVVLSSVTDVHGTWLG